MRGMCVSQTTGFSGQVVSSTSLSLKILMCHTHNKIRYYQTSQMCIYKVIAHHKYYHTLMETFKDSLSPFLLSANATIFHLYHLKRLLQLLVLNNNYFHSLASIFDESFHSQCQIECSQFSGSGYSSVQLIGIVADGYQNTPRSTCR